jgi:hypothetical protein
LCAFGRPAFVYRNVEQHNNHLVAPLEGLGKGDGFLAVYVQSDKLSRQQAFQDLLAPLPSRYLTHFLSARAISLSARRRPT